MNIQDLIYQYEKELSDTLQMFNVRRIEDIPEKPYQWRAGSIRNFIRDIKNLDVETVKLREGCCHPNGTCSSLIGNDKTDCFPCKYWNKQPSEA